MGDELRLRPPRTDDEAAAIAAQRQLAAEDFDFGLWRGGEPWADHLARLAREEQGVDLPPGRVRALFRYAEVGGQVIGRLSVRHQLNDILLAVGGHIGYAVLPGHRRRGHATRILAEGLVLARAIGVDRVLVTCDEDNVASRTVIERAGGRLDPDRPTARRTPDVAVRRYWFDPLAGDG